MTTTYLLRDFSQNGRAGVFSSNICEVGQFNSGILAKVAKLCFIGVGDIGFIEIL